MVLYGNMKKKKKINKIPDVVFMGLEVWSFSFLVEALLNY